MHIKPLLVCSLGPLHCDRAIKCSVCIERSFIMISVLPSELSTQQSSQGEQGQNSGDTWSSKRL